MNPFSTFKEILDAVAVRSTIVEDLFEELAPTVVSGGIGNKALSNVIPA